VKLKQDNPDGPFTGIYLDDEGAGRIRLQQDGFLSKELLQSTECDFRACYLSDFSEFLLPGFSVGFL
jgi:hypothetical protein